MTNRPNILHVFCDQLRHDTVAALGNPVIRTPTFDRLAADGVSFVNAFSPSPVCISARCSMIHGQYPMNTGCYENTTMPTDGRQTFMEVLTDAGYRTHGVGKCHFTPDANALRGFQTRERQEEGGKRADEDEYVRWLVDEGMTTMLEPHGVRGEMYYVPQPSQLPASHHPTQWVGDRSVEFMRTVTPAAVAAGAISRGTSSRASSTPIRPSRRRLPGTSSTARRRCRCRRYPPTGRACSCGSTAFRTGTSTAIRASI